MPDRPGPDPEAVAREIRQVAGFEPDSRLAALLRRHALLCKAAGAEVCALYADEQHRIEADSERAVREEMEEVLKIASGNVREEVEREYLRYIADWSVMAYNSQSAARRFRALAARWRQEAGE